MFARSIVRVLTALLFLALLALPNALADQKLEPIIERLGSSDVADRILALRDMMRMAPSAEKARPIIEQMAEDPDAQVRAELVWCVRELLGGDGADVLETLYGDPDRIVRDAAIRTACWMFEESRTRDLCIAAFEDPDHGARSEVLSTLKEHHAGHPQAAELFRRGLQDQNEVVQRSAVYGAQKARDKKAVDLLAHVAMNSSNMVAVPAADEALATIGSPEAVAHLVNMLPRRQGKPGKPARPNDAVRAAAARALARIKDKSALPHLRKLLDDKEVAVRLGAMEAMLQMKDTESVPLIAKQLAETEVRLRRFALRALRTIGDPRAVPAIRKVLHADPEVLVRETAVATIADIIGDGALADLERAAKDTAASVRLEVAGAAAGLGASGAPILATLVQDPAPEVRTLAIEGIGQVGGPAEIPILVAAAEDLSRRNKQVRGSVADALGRIGHSKCLDPLLALAKDPEPVVRQRAADGLGKVGGEAAVEALQTLSRDQVARVRNSARRALQRLQPKGKAKK